MNPVEIIHWALTTATDEQFNLFLIGWFAFMCVVNFGAFGLIYWPTRR